MAEKFGGKTSKIKIEGVVVMKCKKCHKKNIDNANFCQKCGNKFSEEEKNAVKKGTLVWYLEWIDKIKSLWKFNFITGHILFKILSVIVVLGIGVYSLLINGNTLKILESDSYKIQYNKELSEYYLLTSSDKAELNLYVPNNLSKIKIQHLNKESQKLSETKYNSSEDIILEGNTAEGDYYLIKDEQNKNPQTLKLYIYKEGDK